MHLYDIYNEDQLFSYEHIAAKMGDIIMSNT